MGWEKRGQRLYYYAKKRNNGRVHSRYCRYGAIEDLGRKATAFVQALAKVEDRRWENVARQLGKVQEERKAFEAAVAVLAGGYLNALGFRRHRGQWRRRRGVSAWDGRLPDRQEEAFKMEKDIARDIDEHARRLQSLAEPMLQEIASLQRQIEGGDQEEEARRRLRALFEEAPALWELPGALERRAAARLAALLYGTNKERRAELLRGMARLRAELGYTESGPVERMLIAQVALLWVELQVTNVVYAMMVCRDEMDPKYAAAWGSRIEQVERRYLRAIETLARVRRLTGGTPVLQINVASQQVVANAAGDMNPAERTRPAGAMPATPMSSTTPPAGSKGASKQALAGAHREDDLSPEEQQRLNAIFGATSHPDETDGGDLRAYIDSMFISE